MAYFDSGPIPPMQPGVSPVDQYGNPLPDVQTPGPAYPGPESAASGIDGPPLTPQQVALIRRMAALWGHDPAGMERERTALQAAKQGFTPKGHMVGDVYVRAGPAAAVGAGLGAAMLGPRIAALRGKEKDFLKAREQAGMAGYQMQGLLPYTEEG